MLETTRHRVGYPETSLEQTLVPRVSVRNISKTYTTKRGHHLALDNVSLDIGSNEFVVLLGPSGCGKTTLLRCVAGLEEPDSGEIFIDDTLVFSAAKGIFVPPEKRRFNMVFQSYALWPHLTVSENVAFPLRNIGVSADEARRRAEAALDLVGLGKYPAAYPGQMSGGQQQRVALARAIVSNDGLVLFDEPLSNLDAKVRERLRVELLNLQARIGFSAIYVTHDQTEALALADKIAVMDVGRIAQIGSPRAIYDRPTSRYVADFVGSTNEVPGKLVLVSGTGASVDTPIGRLEGVFGGPSLPEGSDVYVMVRPEHCKLQTIGQPSAGHNHFVCELERSLYLGATVQHVFAIGEHQISVTVSGGDTLQPGERVTISCSPAQTRIFPREMA
ncbi:ABC transporter ATP-binding protein [Rhizobium sp. SSA_523]|uniref:ABC transporter ATP-binding protein n=1 Tax=Rhizobium sp. SSA_523 TaxID=2952477 RepID=UPI002090F6B4|nr:ABC transporter ATP-binding protein [Rhizobium sp. SSA_523]MCO5731587.1 ABC transporter ATP-binding protein [Rhizobium sp. SSA_523]WKC21899.1 ABC transporter ATP-binding protein [Rhizobium sp. SSA_523]